MKSTASIKVACELKEQKDIIKLFATEDKEISNARAKYDIKKHDEGILFEIKAKDIVALRATCTAITRTLSIYEKTALIN